MTATQVKTAKLPSETKLREVVNAVMDADEFHVSDVVGEIKRVFEEDEDRRVTAAELGRLAYFTSNLRASGEGLIRYADQIEENFCWSLEDQTEQ